MNQLRRYWITFENLDRLTALNLGCGITAYNTEDALTLLRGTVFGDKEIPNILDVAEDIDVSTLDENHVLPNIGLVTVRGVWFPQGYM
jgi:hypothetical protein